MLLSAENLSKSFGSRTLFSGVSFRLEEHDAVGLIGANGSGKTTLFRMMTGEDPEFRGLLSRSNSLRLGYMSQHAAKSETVTALEQVLSLFSGLLTAEEHLQKLLEQMQNDHSNAVIQEYTDLRERFEREGGLTFRARARSALLGLGLTEEELSLPLCALSGGQKSKVSLARLLVSDANLLLLDEPTNHLDLNAIQWLEDYLLSFQGAFLVVSHDRYFLDRVTRRTLELEHGKIQSYSGGYTVFKEKKEAERQAAQKHYEEAMKEVHRIEGIIDQQRQWSQERNFITIAHKQKSIDRILDDLEAPEREKKTVSFSFPVREVGGSEVLSVESLTASFGEQTVFSDAQLFLGRGDHAFLLGANGCGKTTLLKSITGQYRMPGEIRLGYGVTVGYFDQAQDDLHPEKDVLSEIWDAYPKMSQTEIRSALGAFLFRGDEVFRKVSTLSGGERARLSLLRLMLSGANLLLLDEPTNHLDIASKEALEEALARYPGTMLIVSHDRYFINRLAGKIFSLDAGGICCIPGNYEDYLQHLQQTEAVQERPEKTVSHAAADYKERKQQESRLRKLQGAVRRLEEQIDQNAASQQELDRELERDEIACDYQKVAEITERMEELRQSGEELLLEWEEKSREAADLEELTKK